MLQSMGLQRVRPNWVTELNKKKNKHIGPNKLKSFCIAKKTKKKMKTTLKTGKSICNWSDQQGISLQNTHTVSGLLSKKKKNQTTLSKIWQKNYRDIYFSNMKFRWWKKHVKRCSTSLNSGDIQIKSTKQLSIHNGQNRHHQKVHKQQMQERVWQKQDLLGLPGGI